LAESYKIKGRIILVRDPNSTEGKIYLSGVRVTAKGSNGEMQVQFTHNKTISVDFVFIEKKREIQFDNGNQLYKFNNIGNP